MELTNYQIGYAAIFYSQHHEHIRKLIKQDVPAYPPTDAEDKRKPALWKANHWKWFLEKYPIV